MMDTQTIKHRLYCDLGMLLSESRNEAGLGVDVAAKALGMDMELLWDLEMGSTDEMENMTLKKLISILEYYEVGRNNPLAETEAETLPEKVILAQETVTH